MRIKKAIQKIKKHNVNHEPLYFYEVKKGSDFAYRILNYVHKHKINFDFRLYYEGYIPGMDDEEEW